MTKGCGVTFLIIGATCKLHFTKRNSTVVYLSWVFSNALKCDLILKDFHKRLNYAVIVTLNRHKLILTHSHTLKWPQKNFDFLFVTFWHDDPRKKRHTCVPFNTQNQLKKKNQIGLQHIPIFFNWKVFLS